MVGVLCRYSHSSGLLIMQRLAPNPGSHILALIRQRLPRDWAERCALTPVLIKTFVDLPRFAGAVSHASGRIHVGTTQGCGRHDREDKSDKPGKHIWLRPSEATGSGSSTDALNPKLPVNERLQNGHK